MPSTARMTAPSPARQHNTVSTCRKSQASIPDAWDVGNWRHVGEVRRGAGPSPALARIRRIVPLPARWPRLSSSPWILRYPHAGVLPGQPQHQVTDLHAGRRTAWPARIGPLASGQLAVPGQQRARRDQPMGAQHGWQLPGQRREDGTVGPVRLGPGDLTQKHRDLMAENHDLRVFGRLAAAEQHQPAEDPGHDQVEQAKGHKPRSCRNQPIRPNSRSQHLRRVLKRYRPSSAGPARCRRRSRSPRTPPAAAGGPAAPPTPRRTGDGPPPSRAKPPMPAIAARTAQRRSGPGAAALTGTRPRSPDRRRSGPSSYRAQHRLLSAVNGVRVSQAV